MITDEEFHAAVRAVRRELRDAEEAWVDIRMTKAGIGKGATMHDVYAGLERAWHAAFDAKELVAQYTLRSIK